ncbi:MAG: phasin [Bauldia sp.]
MNTKTTTKPAKTAAASPFDAFSFPTSAFEFPTAFRELAEKSVSQVRDTYAKMRTAAEDATDLMQGTLESAREGTFALSLKAVDVAKSNSDASFALVRDLFSAKTLSDVIELQSAYARKQFEAYASQFKEIQELTEKLVTETTKPVTERVEKTFKELNVA